MWEWNEPWQSAPDWIVKESGPQWNAPGVVLRFCPDGRFRMATGVFYRDQGHFALGSSDGLALYEGRWSARENQITVRYRLADVEIRFSGMEKVMAAEFTEHPTINGNVLHFTYRRPDTGYAVPMSFKSASSLPDQLSARFVECSAPIVGRPAN
jgi:hypothetical protein